METANHSNGAKRRCNCQRAIKPTPTLRLTYSVRFIGQKLHLFSMVRALLMIRCLIISKKGNIVHTLLILYWRILNTLVRDLFLESSKTFQAYFGERLSECIFKPKPFRCVGLCKYAVFRVLKNVLQDQISETGGSYFFRLVFEARKVVETFPWNYHKFHETLSRLSRNGLQICKRPYTVQGRQCKNKYFIIQRKHEESVQEYNII